MMKFLVKLVMRLLSMLPLRVHYCLADIVSWLAEKVLRYRVHETTVNLARSFPEKKYGELKKIRHEFYRHFGEILAETVWFGGCRANGRLHASRLVEITNPEELNRMYDCAPGVMVLMSHAGNWELIGGSLSYIYKDDAEFRATEQNFCVVYLRQSSRLWDSILRDNRRAPLEDPENYPGYLEARNAVRYVYEHRHEKKIYNFITDQAPYFKAPDYMKVNFMHQDCTSMRGAAALAAKFGMAVCFMSMQSAGRGHYKIKYVPISDDASLMTPEDIMKEYYRLLQADIEQQPWNYLWTHRRWKY
ncbi:MAG: lysophospholipid acyltransferase family protein [Bacteroidales bacterium]|nr:lysophospholipid acyltransferase family protein [Bacteroidales bacterium]